MKKKYVLNLLIYTTLFFSAFYTWSDKETTYIAIKTADTLWGNEIPLFEGPKGMDNLVKIGKSLLSKAYGEDAINDISAASLQDNVRDGWFSTSSRNYFFYYITTEKTLEKKDRDSEITINVNGQPKAFTTHVLNFDASLQENSKKFRASLTESVKTESKKESESQKFNTQNFNMLWDAMVKKITGLRIQISFLG